MDASGLGPYFEQMRAEDESFVVFAGMRNEGPFIVEWVSWYRSLGFKVLIATNDCTDHSPELLDRLAEEGWVSHVRHNPNGQSPKRSAYRAGHNHPLAKSADWVLVCDVDEFLVLHGEDIHTIQDFIGDGERDFVGMAINWRCFGTGGWKRYNDGLVHRQFRRAGPKSKQANTFFKMLFHRPHEFRSWSDHSPRQFSGDWRDPKNAVIDSSGNVLEQFRDPDAHPIRYMETRQVTHRNAQINHYILRSTESYALKKGTPSPTAGTDRYTDQYYRWHNRNDCKEESALQHAARFDPIYEQAMALPGIQRLHHLCCADYVAALCKNADRDPQDDPRWQKHMQQAQNAPS